MLSIDNCRLHPDSDHVASIQCLPGAITVVLGRNQSGKTALCRLVAGLQSGASGDVTFTDTDGKLTPSPTRGLGQKSGPVAMVFQAFVNYPNWTVAQNIASPLVADRGSPRGGITRDEIAMRVRELAALVKIDHLLERMPDELSGGQQQRLAIARALAKEPAVLVMDEPFVNIDFKLREALNTELRSLVDETQVSLLFTTSDPADALALADQLLLLDRHSVLQQGLPLDLYRKPRNLAAANLLSDPAVNRLSATSYVRPEHVKITESDDEESLTALLRAVETNGAESYLHADVTLPEGVQEWVVKTSGIVKAEIDNPIHLRVDARDILAVAP